MGIEEQVVCHRLVCWVLWVAASSQPTSCKTSRRPTQSLLSMGLVWSGLPAGGSSTTSPLA